MRGLAVMTWLWMAIGAAVAQTPAPMAIATFAGGCFWCVEADFDKVPGVISTTSGYTGGKIAHPTYRQVSAGSTGHTEAVRIVYDPAKVTYAQLLEVFWKNHDPHAKNAQFCDHGDQYRAGIYYHDDEQRRRAEASLTTAATQFEGPIHTEIAAAGPFYEAEDYHQDYHLKNPLRYSFYRFNCGRDRRLEQIWGGIKNGKSS